MALVKDKRICELGAGLGIPGLIAAEFAAAVELTDNNMLVVSRLAESVSLNQDRLLHAEVSASELSWGLENLPQARHGLFDAVIGSDLVYSCESVALLLSTADALLKPGGTFVLSYISRWLAVDEAFARNAESHGFTVRCADWPNGEEDEALLLVLCKTSRAHLSLEDATGDRRVEGVRLVSVSGVFSDSIDLVAVGRGPLMLKLADVKLLCTHRQLLCGLRTLNMDRNCLGDASLEVLCSALSLSNNSCLTELSLQQNRLGVCSARSLCIIARKPLQRLILSANGFGPDGAAALVPLIAMSALAVFALASNQLRDDGVLKIARAIAGTAHTIQELDFCDNELTSEGFDLVATTLQGCDRLAKLDLSCNLCEAYGADRLGVSKAAWPLRHLRLARCSLRTAGFARIAPFLSKMTTLCLLDLGGNMCDDDGLAELTPAITGLTNLTSLSLAMGSVGSDPDVLGEFFDVLATLVRLTFVSLRGHCIAADAAPVLMRLPKHVRLDLSDNPIHGSSNDEVRRVLDMLRDRDAANHQQLGRQARMAY
jgi:SAM-dependent methyltransferase